jgi:hypothetical protein
METSTTTTTTFTTTTVSSDGKKVVETSTKSDSAVSKMAFGNRPQSRERWSKIKSSRVEDCRVKFEIELLKDETNASNLKKLGYLHLRGDNDALQFGAMLLTRAMKDPAIKDDSKYWRILAKSHLTIWQKSARLHREKFHLICAFQAYSKSLCFIENITDPSIWAESAQVHELLGSFQGAEQTLARLMKEFPKYPDMAEVVFRAAVVLKQLGKFDQAIGYFMHVAEAVAPPFISADMFFFVARIHIQKQEMAKATQMYQKAFDAAKPTGMSNTKNHQTMQSWIQDPATFTKLGHKCMRCSKPGLAADCFAETLALLKSDQSAQAWLDIAQAYWDCTVHKNAMQAIKAAIKIDPMHSAAKWQLKVWEDPNKAFERSVAAKLGPMLNVTMSDEIAATEKMQAIMRGRAARKEIAEKQEATLKIQAISRGRAGRKTVTEKKASTEEKPVEESPVEDSTKVAEDKAKAEAVAAAAAEAKKAAAEAKKKAAEAKLKQRETEALKNKMKAAADTKEAEEKKQAKLDKEEAELNRKKREAKEAMQKKKEAAADERQKKKDKSEAERKRKAEAEVERKRKAAAERRLKQEEEEHRLKQEELGAVKIQSIQRGKTGRKKAFIKSEMKKAEHTTYEYSLTEEELAKVPKIQAIGRGQADRKKVKNIKRREEDERDKAARAIKDAAEAEERAVADAKQRAKDDAAHLEEVDAATLKLQRLARGNKGRKQARKKKGRKEKAAANKSKAVQEQERREAQEKKELAAAVSMGSFMPHNARLYSYVDGGGQLPKRKEPDSFLDPADTRLDTRIKSSLSLFKRAGYANGGSAYVEHWQKLLEFSFCFFRDRMERRRCVAQVKAFHPTISNAVAFCAIAHCNGSIGEACGKLNDPTFVRDINNVCAVIDVEAFAQLQVQERKDAHVAAQEKSLLQPWKVDTMKTGAPVADKERFALRIKATQKERAVLSLSSTQGLGYRRSSASKPNKPMGGAKPPLRSPVRSMADIRMKAKQQQASMSKLVRITPPFTSLPTPP